MRKKELDKMITEPIPETRMCPSMYAPVEKEFVVRKKANGRVRKIRILKHGGIRHSEWLQCEKERIEGRTGKKVLIKTCKKGSYLIYA